jgi:nucleoside 2-deoxyribosyltransferase
MSERPTVYLAGPVKERADSGATWRQDVADEWGDDFDVADPLAKYDPDDDHHPDAEEIVGEDLAMIDDADAVLVRYAGEPTWGTPMEVRYAHMDNIPVALAWVAGSDLSPWAEVHADYIRPDIGAALDALDDHFSSVPYPSEVIGVERYDASDDIEAAADAGAETGFNSGDAMAGAVASDLADLLTQSRDTHGDAVDQQESAAAAWSWYLTAHGKLQDDETVTGADVARMMALLKMSRAAVGSYDVDHDRDLAGYGTIAAACAVANGTADADALVRGDADG